MAAVRVGLACTMTGGAGLAVGFESGSSVVEYFNVELLPVVLNTTRVPAATTSTVAATRHTSGSTRLRGAATGTTPLGALSSAVRIRDDAAINPRASASADEHCGPSLACAATRAASSALSAPSSHE